MYKVIRHSDDKVSQQETIQSLKLIHIVKTGIAKGNSCTSIFIDESLL